MPDDVESCVEPTAGPIGLEVVRNQNGKETTASEEEVSMDVARVGSKAPDFEASAYIGGQGFKSVRLSDYAGQWVVLCFYPGDFTFV